MSLLDRNILVAVGGGIAAFKSVVLVRELRRRGARVRVAMTPSARHFVGPMTFAGITGEPAAVDLWDPAYPGEVHVELSEWAHAIVVAPATANLMARAVAGMADDVVLATLSCADCPVFFVPAMHERMWGAAATQRNAHRLREDGVRFIGPVQGELASGQQGWGRMSEPADIVEALESQLGPHDLRGLRILISAGPTVEDLDPVRFLSNRSSGRMGYALARRAAARGAETVLVSGPVSLATPYGVERVDVRSARDMHHAVLDRMQRVDAIVMTAAVSDYRPVQEADQKLKKGPGEMRLELVKNPDILADLGHRRQGHRPLLVGFAVETHDLLGYARRKLEEKRVDFVVANEAAVGFGREDTQATLVDAQGEQSLPPMTKLQLSDRILERIAELLEG